MLPAPVSVFTYPHTRLFRIARAHTHSHTCIHRCTHRDMHRCIHTDALAHTHTQNDECVGNKRGEKKTQQNSSEREREQPTHSNCTDVDISLRLLEGLHGNPATRLRPRTHRLQRWAQHLAGHPGCADSRRMKVSCNSPVLPDRHLAFAPRPGRPPICHHRQQG